MKDLPSMRLSLFIFCHAFYASCGMQDIRVQIAAGAQVSDFGTVLTKNHVLYRATYATSQASRTDEVSLGGTATIQKNSSETPQDDVPEFLQRGSYAKAEVYGTDRVPYVGGLAVAAVVLSVGFGLFFLLIRVNVGTILCLLAKPDENRTIITKWAQAIITHVWFYRIAAALMVLVLLLGWHEESWWLGEPLYLTRWSLVLQCAYLTGQAFIASSLTDDHLTATRYLRFSAILGPIANALPVCVALSFYPAAIASGRFSSFTAFTDYVQEYPFSLMTHGVNMVVVLFDVILVGQPERIGDVALPIIVGLSYWAFYIGYFRLFGGRTASGDSYGYAVMDFASTEAPIHVANAILQVFIVIPITSLMFWGIAQYKERGSEQSPVDASAVAQPLTGSSQKSSEDTKSTSADTAS